MMSPRSIERSYPYVVAGLISALVHWLWQIPFPKGHDLLSASITIGAVFTGFLATLKSIVMSVQAPSFEKIRQVKPFFDLLLNYLQESIWMSLGYCFWCLMGYFVAKETTDAIPAWFACGWVFLTIATLLTFQRVSRILIQLMR